VASSPTAPTTGGALSAPSAPAATTTTPATGLTADQVTERVAAGKVNQVDKQTSRPLSAIIRSNVLTRFNAILGALFAAVLAVGSPADALFGLVIVWNALIGIVQELRAKRTLDRLAVLNAPSARVVRDGTDQEVAVGDVVLDDLLRLQTGDQVLADGVVSESDGLEIDESLLTGESDPVDKAAGAQVLSGSIVVAGSGAFQATAVGADSYAQRLAAETKKFTRSKSELMAGINTLLRYISWGLVIIGPILLVSQLTRGNESTDDAVVGTVAALVGMVPEGLVLLTSIAFLVGALTLARRKVLVQELPAVEGLARVDVVCLDKTGTLTDGAISFGELEMVGDQDRTEAELALGALADNPHPNATLGAIGTAFPPKAGWQRTATVPFSSARKWSGATFNGDEANGGGPTSWIMGAPEILFNGFTPDDALRARVDDLSSSGQRVLLVARSSTALENEALPSPLSPVALLTFEEQVRPDAADTMRYFQSQDVGLRVISGDNPRTVGAVAARVGVPKADEPVDARTLPDDQAELAEVLDTRTVFGRVTPNQKRAFVHALQEKAHVVAMTGDGVNDALALKDADIGVAMGNGAPATRAVAQIVLLDGRFSQLPHVVAAGRQVIANIERVASLFLIKNVYSAALAVTVAIVAVPYPFLPRHLTLVSTLTIGLPAFVLSLAPSNERYRPGFLHRVLAVSVPTGLITAIAVMVAYGLARAQEVRPDESRTAATVVAMVIGLVVLFLVAQPLVPWKVALIAAMGGLFALAMLIPKTREFFALFIPWTTLAEALVIGAAAGALVVVTWKVARRRLEAAAPRAPQVSPG
jgi:cation-transporting ATPase E